MATTTTTEKNQIQMSVENKTGEENWTGNAVNKKKKKGTKDHTENKYNPGFS